MATRAKEVRASTSSFTMQCSMDSDFEDENEICYTSKGRAAPPSSAALIPSYDEDSFPSSSWANTNDYEDDQASLSIDYYPTDEQNAEDDFQLPSTSTDLRVSARQALRLATIYEFLRHFSSILRLSPFLFEHFCSSMINSSDLNNILFSQIHLCLLRLLIKQDDDDGISYASETDIKGIVDLSFYTMDYFTWPYILQLYVNSHPQLKFFSSTVKEYPFRVPLDEKIDLLQSICDVALTTKIIRREFDDTRAKQHDDHCRKCHKRGDLLCCDRCEATFHLTCLDPPLTAVPTVQWFCPVCVQNEIPGVTDCIPPREHRPFYLRHRCIGHDRDQRRYWFICRRLFVEDQFADDVKYYSTIEQFEDLLSSLDERGPERLLVYRLQKRYDDIARAMQMTIDLQAKVQSIEDSLMNFTDGATPFTFIGQINSNERDYQKILQMIEWPLDKTGKCGDLPGQIDGIYDDDDDADQPEKYSKSLVNKRKFFVHANENHRAEMIPIKRMKASRAWEEHLRQEHRIFAEATVPIPRLNENDIDRTIWRRYEYYQNINRCSKTQNSSYPRSNYYRDYYTGNNYEDEDGMMLNNDYDEFGEDFFEQEGENLDEFDTPFRKYESQRVYRGGSRGRPRGRGRPPLYGRSAGRNSNSSHPPRGVNHLTTGSFQSHQRFIAPPPPTKNKRKPVKAKTVPVPSASEEKAKRPGRILRSGRISRKPRRDSETDFGSENSDDSGAKDKASGSDHEDEEYRLNAQRNLLLKDRENSAVSTNSNVENDDGSEITIEENHLDQSSYEQMMKSLISSMQPNLTKIDFEQNADYENFYQTNPLAMRKQMLLHERDRRTHLARKFSIQHSPSFSWFAPSNSRNGNYTERHICESLRLTLVQMEHHIPLAFMHHHWRNVRTDWAKTLLDLDREMSLKDVIYSLLQFEASIKPVAFFDLFFDQVGYLKFRRETEKERDEAKKEEKDALIRRKIEADSLVQNVHFTRPLKHSVYRQRGEEYRLTGGQGWTYLRSTRRPSSMKKKRFDFDSLLKRREKIDQTMKNRRKSIEMKISTNDDEMKKIVDRAENVYDDESSSICYKIFEYDGVEYRYPIVSEDTRQVFRLSERKVKKSEGQSPWPWTFTCRSSDEANIFILPSYILRRLARGSMSLTDAPGFLNARLTGIGTRFGWPYPCGRPSVRTAWAFKVRTSSSFFAAAHHLKYLWFCIRWDLIREKIDLNDERTINTQIDADGLTTTTQILAKRNTGPFQSICEYFVRKSIRCQTDETNPFNTTMISSKSRSRALLHPSSHRPILIEQWLTERQLQPNQILFYYRSLEEKRLKRLVTSKPFIVRLPQTSTTNNTSETGKVVLLKLADGQLFLLPTLERSLRLAPPADDLLRMKVCENLLRSMVNKVERDLSNKSRTIFSERVEDLRNEFLQQRTKKTNALLREHRNKSKRKTPSTQSEASSERLYCLCQTPYDESKFYIGCDLCADWFHGTCVQITAEQADKFEVYLCPRCSTPKKQQFFNQSIDRKLQDQLLKLIDELFAHQLSGPFRKPVDSKAVPNYYQTIKDPMDLSTLKTKLIQEKYRTIADFIRDVNKIFNNCRQFNPINSNISQCANVLETSFRQLFERLINDDDR